MFEDPSASESDVRKRMVDATIQLLAEEGPQALQVRKVASAVGVSSMVVYGRFGGMPQLVEAVIEEGFGCLAECFAAVTPTHDAVADMATLALAYHEAGRRNPHLFDLMFGLSTPGGYRPTARPRRTPRAGDGSALDDAYRPVVDRAKRAIRDKRFRRQDPERVAAELWSLTHGFTALSLGGYFSQFADPIADVFAALMTHVAVGLGDSPQRAGKSIAAAIGAAGAEPRPGA